MDAVARFDPQFDFRTDSGGRDPDQASPTLRAYHRLLWSKPLPGGHPFTLDDTRADAYLYYSGARGEFFLASDAAVPTWSYHGRMAHVIAQLPRSEVEEFVRVTYQVGGMMLFPGNRVDGKATVNTARGFHPRIVDRLDLTVECIRRHYLGQDSPLQDVLARYAGFFALFDDFDGYVDFFLLQDLVSPDRTAVEFLTPFDGFRAWPLPATVPEYQAYRARTVDFITARNTRMAQDIASR